ncbi:hypothetical protein ACP3V3_01810 [Vibrio sp. PNB22_3_1]
MQHSAFTDQEKLVLINELLAKQGSRCKVVKYQDEDSFLGHATTNRGAILVVQWVTGELHRLSIRAIHRIKDKRRNYATLFNGQAGRNLETLVFQGQEGEYLTLDKSRMERFFFESVIEHMPERAASEYASRRVHMLAY